MWSCKKESDSVLLFSSQSLQIFQSSHNAYFASLFSSILFRIRSVAVNFLLILLDSIDYHSYFLTRFCSFFIWALGSLGPLTFQCLDADLSLQVLSHPSVMGRAAKHLNLPGGTHDLFQHKAGASCFWGRILRSVTAASLVVWHWIVDNLSQPFATSVSPSSQAIESGHVGSATLGTCHKFWLPTGWVSSEDTNMLLWRC